MSRHARHDKIMGQLRALNSIGEILFWRYTYGKNGMSLQWEIDTGEELLVYGTTHVEAFLEGTRLHQVAFARNKGDGIDGDFR